MSKIKTPVAVKLFRTSDGQTHEDENVAKQHEIMLAARKAILDSLPVGKFNLTPKEAAEIMIEKNALFSELFTSFRRLNRK